MDDAPGQWAADLRLVDYDWAPRDVAERNDRPDVARALRTGRA